MTLSTRSILLVLAAIAVLTTQASATLVKVTDPTSPGGADNVTFSSDTGLYWLDWTASTNITFNNMTTMLGAGGAYEGWRYATEIEVGTLANSVGLPTQNFPDTSVQGDNGAAFFTLKNLVGGYDYEGPTSGFTYAIHPDSVGATRVFYAFGISTSLGGGETKTVSISWPADLALIDVGHVLVRTSLAAVPEPSVVLIGAIVSSGLMATVGRRR